MPLKDKTKLREYRKKYMREVWYPKNKGKHIGYVKQLKQKLLQHIESYKKERCCVDCGFQGKVCPQVLEFDHLGDKKFEISAFNSYILSLDKLNEEINKCELVCANCHRIRTLGRRNKA